MTTPRLAGASALLAGAIALAAMLGWQYDVEHLRSFVPGLVAMNPATAIAALLAASSLWLQRRGDAPGSARLLAALVLAFGFWKLAAITFGFDAGFDRLFFPDRLDQATPLPNRMAPNTALCFALLGGALALLRARGELAQALALAAGGIAFFALLGHLYDLADLNRIAAYIPMALNTALAITLLAFGALAAQPRRAFAAVVTADGPGGYLARRLLPAAVLLPVVLGALRFWGDAGVLLHIVASILLLMALVWATARALERSERGRREAGDRIHELNRELEAFSYTVSHDLRAPLRAIVGFSQALAEDHGAGLDPEARRLLDRVVAAGTRMSLLIDDLLAFSRISRAEMRQASVDMSALAREIVSDLREAEPERQVEFHVAEGMRSRGDPGLLRVLLQNLLANAWKFTARCPRARIEMGAQAGNGDGPVYFVRDDGAGFDMRYADKLFTPFQRLHAASDFDGTGIGLATVQRVAHRHGGRAWAEGRVDGGATFYFTLGE
jgi:signal transduction histidine kinase